MRFPTPGIKDTLGSHDILALPKTAFLCSRKIPAGAVLRCYDWAISQREAGRCIISGFHSTLEKDVLHYLLKGKQHVILALARGLKTRLEPELADGLEQGRLLIISPFEKKVTRVTSQTANVRNELMAEVADEIVVGFCQPGGNIDKLLQKANKPITFLHR